MFIRAMQPSISRKSLLTRNRAVRLSVRLVRKPSAVSSVLIRFFQKTDAILGFPLLPQKPVSLGGQAESFAPQPAVVVEDSVYFLPQRFDKLCTVVHISFERN